VITGLGFAQTQGTGSVIISPTDDVNDAAAVTQTVTSWATNSVTFTAKQVAMLVNAQCYLFVKSSFGLANASGWPVTFKFRGPITPRTILRAQSATVAGS
jgi:hypothetical protein